MGKNDTRQATIFLFKIPFYVNHLELKSLELNETFKNYLEIEKKKKIFLVPFVSNCKIISWNNFEHV